MVSRPRPGENPPSLLNLDTVCKHNVLTRLGRLSNVGCPAHIDLQGLWIIL